MKKLSFICLISLMFVTTLSAAGTQSAMLKSIVLPGWGEKTLNSDKFYVPLLIEGALWAGFGVCLYSVSSNFNAMTNYAELHAGVTSYPDNSNYWADLGNYQSYEDHKETMRENRRTDNIWDISYSWEWDNSDNSQTYRDLRRRKELASVGSQFIIAGLVVNRIASLINVKYLADKNMKAVGGVQHVPGGAALTAGIRF